MISSLLCPDSIPKDLYFFDFSIAPPLMLYSYVPAIVASFFIGFFVMIKSKFSQQGKLLFAISLMFAVWILNYLVQWTIAYVTPDFLSWQLTPIFMVAMFFFSAYFTYSFLEKKDVPVLYKLISSLFFLPILIWLPSQSNMRNFNLAKCEGVAGILWKYIYSLEGLIIALVIFIGIKKYISIKNDRRFRSEVIFLTTGVTLFLGISWLSDVLGEWTKQYQLNFIGPVGMVVFMGFLAYLIVKFKAFNIKLLAAQALVIALILLLSAQFFFMPLDNTINIILISATVLLAVVFGGWLVKSVESEVKRKEELQIMSDKLAQANDQLRTLDNAKSEFISIASHQLRTPLTAIKGFVSLLLEGSYGKLEPKQQDVLNKVYLSNDRLVTLVEDLLNISRIESGRMEFKFELRQVEDICQEVLDTFAIKARGRGLSLEYKKPAELLPKIMIDGDKVREVISNIMDNAIKYTPKGGVTLRVERAENPNFIRHSGQIPNNLPAGGQNSNDQNANISSGEVIRIIVSDTGIGIPETELPYLFAKFSRGKDVKRLGAGGTGLGLYVGRNMIEASGGKIWAESDGEGKGSRFIVELPIGENKAEAEKRLEKFIEKI